MTTEQNITQKTKDRATQTQLNIDGEAKPWSRP